MSEPSVPSSPRPLTSAESAAESNTSPNEVNRSGTAAIVGRANVGKSTLLNAALRERLAIVSPTPQTTRDRILGVLRHGNAQIALVDTPGLHRPRSSLGRRMNTMARDAAREADVLVYVTSIPKNIAPPLVPAGRDVELLAQLDEASRVVLVINKVDLLKKEKSALLGLIDAFTKVRSFDAVVPLSARHQDGIELLLDEIANLLPERGPAYDDDFLTDRPVRFFVSEFVREQVILATRQEIPHNVAVTIERFEQQPHVTCIDARIHCSRDGQRGILIGKGGERLKMIGTAARLRIESFLHARVHLRLWVSTEPGWPESPKALDSFGYVSLADGHDSFDGD